MESHAKPHDSAVQQGSLTFSFLWDKVLLLVEFKVNYMGHAMRKSVRAYADSEDSDQPARMRSLIRAFTVR